MAKKKTFLSKIRGESSNLNEEEELRKELLDLKDFSILRSVKGNS